MRSIVVSDFLRVEKRLNIKEKLYHSYYEALQGCPGAGYEDEEIVRVVYEKTKRYREQLLKGGERGDIDTYHAARDGVLKSLLASMGEECIYVLDVGGGCGVHYFKARSLLDKKSKLRWFVVETPRMCECARNLEDDELKFYESLHEARQRAPFINLIFTSGALQYTPNPYSLLEEITESNAEYLFVTRLHLVKGSHDVITIQKSMLSWNGIGLLPKGFRDRIVSYPIIAMQKNKFDSIIKKKYVYELELKDNSGVVPVNKEPIVGGGVLGRLKSN